jgi:hypothetical protein
MNWFKKRENAKYLIDGYGASERGMTWYNFCLYFRLPLTAVMLIYSLITQFEYITDIYFLFGYLIVFIMFLSTLSCCYFLPILDKKGYYSIMTFLVINICISLITAFYDNPGIGSTILLDIIQIVYFYKRRDILKGKYNYTDNENIVNETETEKTISNQNSESSISKEKIVYCKQCGSPLDENKKCTGCGKQYFKIPKIKTTTIIVSVFLVIVCLLGLGCLYLTQQNIMLKEEIDTVNEKYSIAEKNYKNQLKEKDKLQSKYDELEKKYDKQVATNESLRENLYNYKLTAEVWDEYGAVTIDSDYKYYHTYTCDRIKSAENNYLCTKWDAEDMGYKPCPDCH